MKVIILCGGQGTRIREAGELKPKPMLEVGNQPILWHILKMYSHHGSHERRAVPHVRRGSGNAVPVDQGAGGR